MPRGGEAKSLSVRKKSRGHLDAEEAIRLTQEALKPKHRDFDWAAADAAAASPVGALPDAKPAAALAPCWGPAAIGCKPGLKA